MDGGMYEQVILQLDDLMNGLLNLWLDDGWMH